MLGWFDSHVTLAALAQKLSQKRSSRFIGMNSSLSI
jgi:hypothetical protein